VKYGHSLVVNPLGQILAEADEHEATVFADIGWSSSLKCVSLILMTDTEMLATTRRNLPVTIQRRFDVYPDISA
jgi:predicted amidohydrolase